MSKQIISARPTTVPDCSRPNCALRATPGQRGFCRKHYKLWCKANPPVDSAPITAHVRELRAAGFGIRRIAKLTGVGKRTIEELLNGTTKFTLAPTAAALMTLQVDGTQLPARLNPVGVTRRLRALSALGYTDVQIAARLGIDQANLWRHFHAHTNYVTAATRDNVDRVYRDLEMVPAPTGWIADRARRRAAANGWLPPFAWDAETIDDPSAEPDPSVVRAAAATGKLADTFPDEYLELRDWIGLDDEAIAERLGITLDALDMRKRRYLSPADVQGDELEAAS